MPRPRTFLSIHELPLIGGNLALDFANTTSRRASGSPRERLHSYADLLVWCRRVGIMDAGTEHRLLGAASRRRIAALRALARMRTLREDLHTLLSEVATGHQAPAMQLARLNDEWRAARGRQVLLRVRHSYQLTFVADTHDLAWMALPIVESAVTLLTSPQLALLRQCGDCEWLYVDDTKNHSRRWCQDSCGNRARSRRRQGVHRQR